MFNNLCLIIWLICSEYDYWWFEVHDFDLIKDRTFWFCEREKRSNLLVFICLLLHLIHLNKPSRCSWYICNVSMSYRFIWPFLTLRGFSLQIIYPISFNNTVERFWTMFLLLLLLTWNRVAELMCSLIPVE